MYFFLLVNTLCVPFKKSLPTLSYEDVLSAETSKFSVVT